MKKDNYFLNKNYISLCIINFVMCMGQFIGFTLVPKYADALGGTAVIVGVVSSVFAASALIIKPFSGPAIDSFSKKKILLIGNIILLASFLGYSIVKSITMLIAFRLLHGFAMGVNVITCLTMVSDILPEKKLTSGVAYYSMIQALSTAIGPSLGLFLVDEYGYSKAFLVGAGFVSLAIIILLFWNVPEKTEKKPYKISLSSSVAKEALPSAVTMLFLAAAYVSISSFLVLYAESIGVYNIGIYFTVYAIALLVSRPLIGRISERFGISRVLPVSIVIFAIGMLLISYSKNINMFLVSAVLVAFGYGACQPLVQALCMKSVPSDRRGSASATGYYGTDIGYLMAPALSGYIVDHYSYSFMFRCMDIYLVFALIIFIVIRKKIVQIEKAS